MPRTRTFECFREAHLYEKLLELHTEYLARRLHVMHEFELRGLTVDAVRRVARWTLVDGSTPENRDRIGDLMRQLEHVEKLEERCKTETPS
jgi:hypothetical protein